MIRYALTALAKADVRAIWAFIAADSENNADRVVAAIHESCRLLARSPTIGHTRRQVTARNLRFWTMTRYPNYTVVYHAGTKPLRIVAVLHGRRNAKRILGSRS